MDNTLRNYSKRNHKWNTLPELQCILALLNQNNEHYMSAFNYDAPGLAYFAYKPRFMLSLTKIIKRKTYTYNSNLKRFRKDKSWTRSLKDYIINQEEH